MLCVRLSARPSSYICDVACAMSGMHYALMYFHQTFANGAPWDKSEVAGFGVIRSKGLKCQLHSFSFNWALTILCVPRNVALRNPCVVLEIELEVAVSHDIS